MGDPCHCRGHGTQNQNAEWVAKSIENGLARQKYYLNGDDNQSDLIYRANDGDKVDDVANYFGTESNELKQFNSIDGSECKEAQTIINPAVQNDLKIPILSLIVSASILPESIRIFYNIYDLNSF